MEDPPTEMTVPIAQVASDALGTPMKELPPLADSVDIEGLTAVATGDSSHEVTVSFTYAGLRVLVQSGLIYCRPIETVSPGPTDEMSTAER